MSKENTVEENVAGDAATNEDDNTPVTSRKYKITVCVITVLLAIVFLVKDYVIFRMMMSGSLSDGGGIADFVKWWLDERKWYLIAGVVIMLIPYEMIYNHLQSDNEIMDMNSGRSRRWITVGTLLIMLGLAYAVTVFDDLQYMQMSILCVVSLGFVLFMTLKPYFQMTYGWLAYASLYNTLNFGFLLYSIHRKADSTLNPSNPMHWMKVGYADVFLIIVCFAAALGFMIYKISVDDKEERTLLCIISDLVVGVVIPVAIVYFPARSALETVDNKLYQLMGISTPERTGIEALKNPRMLAQYIVFAIISVLMVYAAKKVAEYSKRRMAVLLWLAIFMFIILIVDLVSELGIGARYASFYSIYDMVNALGFYIAIRTLIIPVKSRADLECKFIDADTEIIDMKYEDDSLEVSIDSLNKQVRELIKISGALELRLKIANAEIECLKAAPGDDVSEYEDYIRDVQDMLDKMENNKETINRKMLYDRIYEIRKEEVDQLHEINKERYRFADLLLDDDEDAAEDDDE